jgi:hypothetical protein
VIVARRRRAPPVVHEVLRLFDLGAHDLRVAREQTEEAGRAALHRADDEAQGRRRRHEAAAVGLARDAHAWAAGGKLV